jgi:hypothetical protein
MEKALKIINEEISNRELINKNTNAFQSEIAELKEVLKVLNNDYKKDKLIVKQQLTIEDYKESLIEIKKSSQHIRYKFTNIGGPLNDNDLQFNQEQLKFINKIAKLVEDIEYLAEDMTNENE